MSAHAHPHGDVRAAAEGNRRLLALAFLLLILFMAAEVAVGIAARSLALLADAGHMLTDAAALGIALFASVVASRPARGRWTFGFVRAEILAAQANGLALALIAVWIVYAAIRRLIHPPDVDAALVLPVAVAGIAVNLVVVALLARAERQSLNIRGAYLHVATDAAAFAGTALAALLILATGWDRFDAIASLLVAALALAGAWSLLRESGRIFLEGAPSSAPPREVGAALAAHPGVVDVHDLHVWTVTSGFPALAAHVLVEPDADCHRIRLELERLLAARFRIDHTTLQVEHVGVESGLAIRRSPR
ncbi:MAG: cation diffusion facilitator family transporter [Actinomycetota bacterium]|nr:cation diffusion facilitator family transporter [Actinomycetota bacterium]